MDERHAVKGYAVSVGGDAAVNPELLKPEWKLPPPGAQSATSRQRIKAIVYENHQALPHYLLTYTAGPRPNPYKALDPPLCKIDQAPHNSDVRVRKGQVQSWSGAQERAAAAAVAKAAVRAQLSPPFAGVLLVDHQQQEYNGVFRRVPHGSSLLLQNQSDIQMCWHWERSRPDSAVVQRWDLVQPQPDDLGGQLLDPQLRSYSAPTDGSIPIGATPWQVVSSDGADGGEVISVAHCVTTLLRADELWGMDSLEECFRKAAVTAKKTEGHIKVVQTAAAVAGAAALTAAAAAGAVAVAPAALAMAANGLTAAASSAVVGGVGGATAAAAVLGNPAALVAAKVDAISTEEIRNYAIGGGAAVGVTYTVAIGAVAAVGTGVSLGVDAAAAAAAAVAANPVLPAAVALGLVAMAVEMTRDPEPEPEQEPLHSLTASVGEEPVPVGGDDHDVDHFEYEIAVRRSPSDGQPQAEPWRTWKRYSEFFQLHSELTGLSGGGVLAKLRRLITCSVTFDTHACAPFLKDMMRTCHQVEFPEKTWLRSSSTDPTLAQDRNEVLYRWLKAAIILCPRAPPLVEFLKAAAPPSDVPYRGGAAAVASAPPAYQVLGGAAAPAEGVPPV